MRLVVFGPDRRVGAVHGEVVVDLALASAGAVPASLREFIEGGSSALEASGAALGRADAADAAHSIESVEIHPPLVDRGARIMCAASNYPDHFAGMRRVRHGESLTVDEARRAAREAGITGFWKLAPHVVGQGDEIVHPDRTGMLDYEGEVAIVLGGPGKDVPADRAGELIWGYTLLNDLSARDQPNPRPHSFVLGKNFDSSGSLGPCISVGEIADPHGITFETHVNGERRQSGTTRDMIFSFEEFIEHLSRDMTLLPGDVISGGTCAGTAMDGAERDGEGRVVTDRFLRPGDRVEVSSPMIGTLANHVVSKR